MYHTCRTSEGGLVTICGAERGVTDDWKDTSSASVRLHSTMMRAAIAGPCRGIVLEGRVWFDVWYCHCVLVVWLRDRMMRSIQP